MRDFWPCRSLLQNILLISAKLNSTNLWCVVLYVTYSTTQILHTRGPWKFSLADTKTIFCRSDLWSKSCAAWNVFPINSLMLVTQLVQKLFWSGIFSFIGLHFYKLLLFILIQPSQLGKISLHLGTNYIII